LIGVHSWQHTRSGAGQMYGEPAFAPHVLQSYTANAPYRLGEPFVMFVIPFLTRAHATGLHSCPKPMNLSATHLKRYRQIAVLLWKYGRSDIVQQMAVQDGFDPEELKAEANDAAPEQLADDLEKMVPTYVKLGQVLAGRPDLLPVPYLKALVRLQDKAKPFAYEEVEQILLAELGLPVFSTNTRRSANGTDLAPPWLNSAPSSNRSSITSVRLKTSSRLGRT